MNYAVTYVSTASRDLNAEEISELLKYSKENNNSRGITGILLFSEGNFFQIIEGEKEKILELYQRIKTDKRHHNLIQIVGKEIHNEAYNGYEADFISEGSYINPEKFQHYLNYLRVCNKINHSLAGFIT